MADLVKVDAEVNKLFFAPKSDLLKAVDQALGTNNAILPAATLVRQALTLIKASGPLQKCSVYSLVCAVVETAQAGLSLDLHLGQAFLVPYSGAATVQYGYRGLIELARRSGLVQEMVGEIRYSKDKFQIRLGSSRELIHEPLDAPVSKRGEILGAYAVAIMSNGGPPIFEWMDIEQIHKIRDAVLKRKHSDRKSPWELDGAYEEMVRKTPIRRIAKRMPQSPTLISFVRAAVMDEYRDQGIYTPPVVPPRVTEVLEDAGYVEQAPVEEREPEPVEQSQIKEKPVKEAKVEKQNGNGAAKPAASSGPLLITEEHQRDVMAQMEDLGIKVAQLPKFLKMVGHKTTLDKLPDALFKDLSTAMTRESRQGRL